ncbi:MAG: hypothetical protein JNN15_01140 [Blastocatellia bacterium]|nr:hypothetical protein [Blastocatellia bacterium]
MLYLVAVLGQAGQTETILKSLEDIKEKLPFLFALTVEERVRMVKLGSKSLDFVEKSLTVAKQNPEIMPRGFDIDEFEKDVSLYRDLEEIRIALTNLLDLVSDTSFLAGSEAYAGSLVTYSQAKNTRFALGLETAVDDMGKRFARKAKKNGSTDQKN